MASAMRYNIGVIPWEKKTKKNGERWRERWTAELHSRRATVLEKHGPYEDL